MMHETKKVVSNDKKWAIKNSKTSAINLIFIKSNLARKYAFRNNSMIIKPPMPDLLILSIKCLILLHRAIDNK